MKDSREVLKARGIKGGGRRWEWIVYLVSHLCQYKWKNTNMNAEVRFYQNFNVDQH